MRFPSTFRTPGRQAVLVGFLLAALIPYAGAASGEPTPERLEFFERKIRPVLVAECYECHTEEKRKGGLALNSRDGWMKGGDSGAAIIPGEPEKSLLIRSIRHIDDDPKMPSKAPKLDHAVIADFVHWVKIGAPDPRDTPERKSVADGGTWAETLATRRQRWCFQPVRTPAVPAPGNAAWSAHPVDRFLLEKQEVKGLAPAADADARVVIRRLSFALTGLPPAIEEVERFVARTKEDRGKAIAEATDRLLASPAYGEKWARHWLDMARYAETFGSEHDYLNPHAWRYRDYVIRAFNEDIPYDRFAQEQIAGDLLEPRWNEELGINEAQLGTAWHRMVESYASPVDVKREEISIIDWQIEALGKTFLGLTIQCARCHDHKFDPISDEDFYALYGVFASTRPTLAILDEPGRLTAHDGKLRQLKSKLREALAAKWQADAQPAAIEKAFRAEAKDGLAEIRELAKADNFGQRWKELRQKAEAPLSGKVFADLTTGDLGGWRASGPGLPRRPGKAGGLSLQLGDSFVRAIQPAGFYSDAVSERHGGSLRSQELVLERGAVSVLASGAAKARLRLVIENFQNDLLLFSGVNPDLESAAPKWFTMRVKEQWIGRRARVELLTRDEKTCVGHKMDQVAWAKTDGRSAFGIQKVVLHDGAPPAAPRPLPSSVLHFEAKSWSELAPVLAESSKAAAARWGRGEASDDDARWLQALLEAGILTRKLGADPEIDRLVNEFRAVEARIPEATRAPGVVEDGHSYDSPLFPRGDHTKPGAPVPRRFLEVLGGAPLGGERSGRLELARAIASRDNPLTARVMANRVWHHLTGRGLVQTVDNFGKMGESPTHPELLDHLTIQFMKDGWSVKSLIRHIVTSRAWQISSEPPVAALEADPENELLASARPRRLEAEAIRDAMLAVAGNLKAGHSGPGIHPFYRASIDPDKQPKAGPIDGNGRRSIYLEARRLFPVEFLAAFDAPKPNIFTGQRSETTVPAQSLALLNDPFVLHQAGVWARRVQAEESSEEQRIIRMYQEALARPPAAAELANAAAFVNEIPKEPWQALAHAMFNMKEFIYLP